MGPKKSTFNPRIKWTYCDILIYHHHEELNNITAEISGLKVGSKGYIRCYHRAIKQIEDSLSEETCRKYRAEAEEWSEKTPSHSRQYLYVHANHCSGSDLMS